MLGLNLSRLLHEQGKNRYRENFEPMRDEDMPEEWKTTFYKEYGRFEATDLPTVEPEHELTKLIRARRTRRQFSSKTLTLEQLSLLLKYACGEFTTVHGDHTHTRRAYPSGGSRYPTEVYLLIRDVEGLKSGVYHYNVKHHRLEYLWEEKETKEDPRLLVYNDWAAKTPVHIFLTSVFWRTQDKYRMRGYRYACIEIGAVIQNFYLLSGLLGCSCVAYGGVHDDQVEQLLNLNTEEESLVTSVLIG